MNLQDISNLIDAVDERTGLTFQHYTYMDGTSDLKINGQFIFQHVDKFTLTGGAKSLDQLGAFLNGILFGMDY
jgi:hypothetical protein